jgi:hypothetical protein
MASFGGGGGGLSGGGGFTSLTILVQEFCRTISTILRARPSTAHIGSREKRRRHGRPVE